MPVAYWPLPSTKKQNFKSMTGVMRPTCGKGRSTFPPFNLPQRRIVALPLAVSLKAPEVLFPQVPLAQPPLLQSEGAEHFLPSAHFGHCGPPQSASVSCPSLRPFLQLGGVMHTPLLHSPLWQSEFTRHFLPSAHGVHSTPPQSVSVSAAGGGAPSCIASEQ